MNTCIVSCLRRRRSGWKERAVRRRVQKKAPWGALVARHPVRTGLSRSGGALSYHY